MASDILEVLPPGVEVRWMPRMNGRGLRIRPKGIWNRLPLVHRLSSAREIVGADLSGVDLNRCLLTHLEFRNCLFNGASFAGTELGDVGFYDCSFLRADWSGSNLKSCTFARCRLTGGVLEGCRWTYTTLRECDLHRVDARYANLQTTIVDCDATAGDYQHARLRWTAVRTDFSDGDFRQTRFDLGDKTEGIGCFIRHCKFLDVAVDDRGSLYQIMGGKFANAKEYRPKR